MDFLCKKESNYYDKDKITQLINSNLCSYTRQTEKNTLWSIA